MNEKRVLIQLRNCNAEERAHLEHFFKTIFPMSVEGGSVVQCGFVPPDEGVVGMTYDMHSGQPLAGCTIVTERGEWAVPEDEVLDVEAKPSIGH